MLEKNSVIDGNVLLNDFFKNDLHFIRYVNFHFINYYFNAVREVNFFLMFLVYISMCT